MNQMFISCFALHYNIIQIKDKKITKVFKEQFEDSIQENAQCMHNAITNTLLLKLSVWADEGSFRPWVWVNGDVMIPNSYI